MDKFTPKPFVFVLMPFDPAFDDIYKLGIKKACENAGAYAERVDEQVFDGSILQRIYNQIDKADIIVSDMTGKNANTFYETGYAHALGKTVILLTQNADDIPFDLKYYPHITYKNRIVDLLPELERRVRYFIENPEKGRSSLYENIRLLINNTSLENDGKIAVHLTNPSYIPLEIKFHNNSEKVIQTESFSFGIIAPKIFDHITLGNKSVFHEYPIDKNNSLWISDVRFDILPNSWDSSLISFLLKSPLQPCELNFIFRIFRESGSTDINSTIAVQV